MTMKQLFLIATMVLGFLLSTVETTSAQSAELGVRLMPLFSSFDLLQSSSGEIISGKPAFGYGAGGFLSLNFTDHLGVQSELMYNTLNQKFAAEDLEGNVKLQYLNVPVLVSYNSNKSRIVNLNLVAGPQLGISAGSEVNLKLRTEEGSTVDPVLISKRGDIGFAYGGGIDVGLFPLKSIRLGVGIRGGVSLLDISDDRQRNSSGDYYIDDSSNPGTFAGYIGLSILL